MDKLDQIIAELKRQSDRLERIERMIGPASMSVKQEAAQVRAQGRSVREYLRGKK